MTIKTFNTKERALEVASVMKRKLCEAIKVYVDADKSVADESAYAWAIRVDHFEYLRITGEVF